MYNYTLCFLRMGSRILMLNRFYSPMMGLWNGIGGKLEAGETPEQCVRREVREETGIAVKAVSFAGEVKWVTSKDTSGMYVYVADVPSDVEISFPAKVEEGILDWKELDWLLNPANSGLADSIRDILPDALDGNLLEHRYEFDEQDRVDAYRRTALSGKESIK